MKLKFLWASACQVKHSRDLRSLAFSEPTLPTDDSDNPSLAPVAVALAQGPGAQRRKFDPSFPLNFPGPVLQLFCKTLLGVCGATVMVSEIA